MAKLMETLMIGYGNSLRSDDGAGQAVAEAIADRSLPGVRVLSVHQLTPDLAADMATVDRVFFVDAVPWADDAPPRVQIQSIDPHPPNNSLGHHCDPGSILALSGLLFHHIPDAYWVLIPALNFEFGETFSEVTQMAIEVAINQIANICRGETVARKCMQILLSPRSNKVGCVEGRNAP
jgi:hydrogenase maturation protease